MDRATRSDSQTAPANRVSPAIRFVGPSEAAWIRQMASSDRDRQRSDGRSESRRIEDLARRFGLAWTDPPKRPPAA